MTTLSQNEFESSPEVTTPLADMHTVASFPAHVVEPGPTPRLHGYGLHDDLARHYTFAESILLALTGELPERNAGRAFSVAMTFLMDTPITEAATHAARVCVVGKGGIGSVASVGALGVVAQCQRDAQDFDAVLAAIEVGRVPRELAAHSYRERLAVARLRTALPWPELGLLASDIALLPAILATLIRCGIRSEELATVALIHGRLVSTLAEGFGSGDRSFSGLPAKLPEFFYVSEEAR